MVRLTWAHKGVHRTGCLVGCTEAVQDAAEDMAGGLQGHAVDGEQDWGACSMQRLLGACPRDRMHRQGLACSMWHSN